MFRSSQHAHTQQRQFLCVSFFLFFFCCFTLCHFSLPRFFFLLLLLVLALNCITPSPSGWRQQHAIRPWTARGSNSKSNHPGFCIHAVTYKKHTQNRTKKKTYSTRTLLLLLFCYLIKLMMRVWNREFHSVYLENRTVNFDNIQNEKKIEGN